MAEGGGTPAQVRELIQEFKPNSGQLLACLHKVQHHFGYLSVDAVNTIARQLRMTPAEVFGAITFYSEFRTSPPPQVAIHWCSGPACRLKGGESIRKAIEAVLDAPIDVNTAGDVTAMHIQQCDGSCEYAPLIWLRRAGAHHDGPFSILLEERGEVRGPLRVADAIELARKLKAGETNV